MITIFQHITKTGGSTMRGVVMQQYDRLFLYGGGGDPRQRLNELPTEERESLECIYGHLPFGVHRCLDRPSRYFTMLREPVDRAISLYHHILSKSQHPLHEKVTKQRMTLQDCVEEFVAFHNNQTRYLTGITHHAPLEPSVVEQAMNNLDAYYVAVGITERYDESLLLMRRRLGWKWSGMRYQRRNVNHERPDVDALPPATLQTIRERSSLDMEIYRYACARLENDLKQEGLSLQVASWYYQGEKEVRRQAERIGRFTRRCRKAVERRL
jgi:hypothetical protein